ncbi:hypothetical protein [Streptomyces sp. URMC 123]|uniref:hypothetical protein n=1 Tax=Streptomyces sp. URMC 123 TaxID=3423403 RepID=UPI003F1A3415
MQVTAVPLVERRRAGETFPRIPIGSVELTREQAAAGLLAQLDTLPALPVDWQLLSALERAVDEHGVAELDARIPSLEARPEDDRAVQLAFNYAYRLCVEHWYEGALSEEISQYLMAPALYASDLPMQDRDETWLPATDVDGHLAEGIAYLGIRAVVTLGADAEREFGLSWALRDELSAAYRTAMPDTDRRRFCFEVAVNRCAEGPRPLMVWFDDGSFAVGATPPEAPNRRNAAARWQARIQAVREGRA